MNNFDLYSFADENGSFLWIIWLIAFLFVLIAVPMIIGFWKIFEKAGEEGWKILIPFYGYVVLLKIVGKPAWWIIFLVLPYCFPNFPMLNLLASIANLVFTIWFFNMLALSFGRESGFAAWLVFFPFVALPILGFGKDKYLGPYGNPELFRAYRAKDEAFDFEKELDRESS